MSHDRPVVLVVEDDVELNELECEILQVHGMDTVPAYSGSEALELSTARRADAVLLDVMLPEMDGYETCEQLRRKAGKDLPIVMLTALNIEACRSHGFESGADAYFTKPFDPDEVVRALSQLMERQREPFPEN